MRPKFGEIITILDEIMIDVAIKVWAQVFCAKSKEI
jgi:hypothetical protein